MRNLKINKLIQVNNPDLVQMRAVNSGDEVL
jgi:hypothetical protein